MDDQKQPVPAEPLPIKIPMTPLGVLSNTAFTPDQKLVIEQTVKNTAARIENIEAQAQTDYYTSLLQEIDAETDGGIYEDLPDLKLAIRCFAMGAWRNYQTANSVFTSRIVPLLTSPDGNEIVGFKQLILLKNEFAGMLTQSSENVHMLSGMRADFGSLTKFGTVMASIDNSGATPTGCRQLKIAAAGILAGAAEYDRNERAQDLCNVLLS